MNKIEVYDSQTHKARRNKYCYKCNSLIVAVTEYAIKDKLNFCSSCYTVVPISETEANSYLQQEIEEAIRKRQRNFPGILNPKDVRRLTERAIIVIVRENMELNDAQQKDGE